MLGQYRDKRDSSAAFNSNSHSCSSEDTEHFNYKNYILQQKDLLSKIHQQQKKLKKFSQRNNARVADLAKSPPSSLPHPVAANVSHKKILVDSHSANLLLNSLHLENLKNTSNALKPYSPNFSKKKYLILNQ